MIRRPPRSTLFPTRRSSDLVQGQHVVDHLADGLRFQRIAVVGAARSAHARSEEHTLNSSHGYISYAVFCLKKKKHQLISLSTTIIPTPPPTGSRLTPLSCNT